MQEPHQNPAQIEADDSSEFGSAQEESSVVSLRSSILENRIENGRTYHSMSAGKYNFPNDEKENDRLDLQFSIWSITLDGDLALSPGHKTAKRVLDVGTGTGIWACEFADEFPDSEVIGVDLSPIQPEWAPPNCVFEIDDIEKDWTWTKPFDFIHCRAMEGCFADPRKFIEQAYKALTPGGWLEVGACFLPMGCDDESVPEDSPLRRWHNLLMEAAEKIGRPMKGPAHYPEDMERVGFANLITKDFVWPLNSWPKDEKLKEIGRWHFVNLDTALEALSLALLTRGLEWTQPEVLVLCAEVRQALKNKNNHAYWKIRIVCAQKPEMLEEEEKEEAT